MNSGQPGVARSLNQNCETLPGYFRWKTYMIFVQTDDGMFCTNPIFHGKNWYLRCTDEGCEVRIKKYANTSQSAARTRASRVLRERGLSVKLGDYLDEDTVPMPPKFDSMLEVVGFEVRIRKPTPKPDKFDTQVNSPALEHPFLAWKMEFSREAIESILDKSKRMNPMLVKFLTGDELVRESDRKSLQRKLRKMIPNPLTERVTLDS